MHEFDKVSRQFEFKQLTLVAPQDLDDLHPIDLVGRPDENCIRFHAEYINIWSNWYEFLPSREAIFIPDLPCYLEYMPWFRLVGKPYLRSEEDGSGKPHTRRPQRSLTHPRSSEVGPLFAYTQEPTSMPTPPPGQYMSSYSGAYVNPIIFTQARYIPPHFSISPHYTMMQLTFLTTTMSTTTYRMSMFRPPTKSPVIMPLVYKTQYSYTPTPMVTQTPPGLCSIKIDHLPNHLFLDQRMHEGN
ncbi:uncharacterized protein [Gossypium hirsutum]|uniref:Uncharacterized protein isoform X1 n=1 Tax=Gossypium hirsutum TaxID=3635 RepID=A0ABM3BGI7_GOSHI|nr:uncharacterized protein LOC107919683 isoform X1 [Gossypium hirsutum]